MLVLHEIKNDGAKTVGVIMDHGRRGGQDHFVIVISWSSLKSNGEKTVKFFVPVLIHLTILPRLLLMM